MIPQGVVKGVVFYIKDRNNNKLPEDVFWLMKEYRLMVNKAIRNALATGITSRGTLCKSVYKGFREEHDVYSQYIPAAVRVAAGLLKAHRKRLRKYNRKQKKGKGKNKTMPPKVPFSKRLYIKCENQTYQLDRKTGVLRLPIRAGKHVHIELEVSSYHRQYLDDESLVLGSLTITPRKLVVAFRKRDITPFVPETVISLDTNERSLDGVFVSPAGPKAIQLDISKNCVIQERHNERRKRLQKKKVHDRRTQRKLCGREGQREHNRVEAQLYLVAHVILKKALAEKSVIILEDLTGLKLKHWSKRLKRRISSWPRRRLHAILQFMARWSGIPIIFVDPSFTSVSCPICGSVYPVSRMDRMFRCACGWDCPKHINASLNIMIKAASFYEDVARAAQGRPDASWHDPMMSLYDLETGARTEGNGMSGMVGG